jgi:hypothetical protein
MEKTGRTAMEKMAKLISEIRKDIYEMAGGSANSTIDKIMCLLDLMGTEISSLKGLYRIPPMPIGFFNPMFPGCISPGLIKTDPGPEEKREAYHPQSKEEQDIYDHLLSKGCNDNEAASIAKEMMNLAAAGGE